MFAISLLWTTPFTSIIPWVDWNFSVPENVKVNFDISVSSILKASVKLDPPIPILLPVSHFSIKCKVPEPTFKPPESATSPVIVNCPAVISAPDNIDVASLPEQSSLATIETVPEVVISSAIETAPSVSIVRVPEL